MAPLAARLFHRSLKQGIDDGFLAPYRVYRIVTQWDAAGWGCRHGAQCVGDWW